MMQLLEVILVEIREEPRRPYRMPSDFEIVNVPVPVVANVGISSGAGGWHRVITIIDGRASRLAGIDRRRGGGRKGRR
jgi:hypothetical protein